MLAVRRTTVLFQRDSSQHHAAASVVSEWRHDCADRNRSSLPVHLVTVEVATGTERIFPVDGVSTLAWLDDASLVLSRRAEQSAALQLWRLSYPEGKLSRLTNDLNSYAGVSVTGDRGSLVTAQRVTRIGIWVGDRLATQGAEVVQPRAWKQGRRRVGGRPPRLHELHRRPAIDRQRRA